MKCHNLILRQASIEETYQTPEAGLPISYHPLCFFVHMSQQIHQTLRDKTNIIIQQSYNSTVSPKITTMTIPSIQTPFQVYARTIDTREMNKVLHFYLRGPVRCPVPATRDDWGSLHARAQVTTDPP